MYGPSTVQEAVNLIYDAFDKAEKYRLPVMILGDGMLGQIMEPVDMPPMKDAADFPVKPWAADGSGIGKDRRIINSLYIEPDELEKVVHRLFARYAEMEKYETKFEEYKTEDAEIILTAYGTVARICKSAVEILRSAGIKAGLLRPITLFPFPSAEIQKLARKEAVGYFLTVELSMGQMVEDVRLAVNGLKPVDFYGRTGGVVMSAEDVAGYIMKKEAL